MATADEIQLRLDETVSEPVSREPGQISESDGGEESPEEEDREVGSEDADAEEKDAEGNPGWADAMARVLRTNKPKRKRSVVLSKARRIQDVASEKVKAEDPESEMGGAAAGPGGEPGVVTRPEPRKRKKVWENKGRVKPDVLDRNRERILAKIATKGVVQLFNAVREHQKTLDSRIREAGKSELKREKILKSVDKEAFLEVLGGNGKTKAVAKEEPDSKPATWKVLREDFMMGAKLKDWDKDEDQEDTER